MFPVELHGTRVTLREFARTDVDAVHAYASDPEVVRFMLWGPNTLDDSAAHVERMLAVALETPRWGYALAIVLDDHMIGSVDVRVRGAQGELGYILRRDMWNCGYMTEAAKLLAGFAFEHLGVNAVVATCDTENVGSFRVMEKIGMTRVTRRPRGDREEFLYRVRQDEFTPGTA